MMAKAMRIPSNFYNKRSLTLASASAVRKRLLQEAGLEVKVVPSHVDEAAVRETLLSGEDMVAPDDVAEILARTKADDVSQRANTSVLIAADQVLYFDGKIFEKPSDMDEARANLLSFSGHMHTLHSAVVVVVDGKAIWSHVDVARIWIRHISPEFVGRYLARFGKSVLASVGCYELEGLGVHLIEKIEGDYFTVLGLPLLPLLDALRERDIIDS